MLMLVLLWLARVLGGMAMLSQLARDLRDSCG